jgi:iron complex transport system substrate-binding protein
VTVFLLLLAGLGASSPAAPLAVMDDLGVTVYIASVPRRVVCLSPGATEIVYALGAGKCLSAVCRQCDYPAQAKKLPQTGDFMNPSLEAVMAVRPDLVVTTGGVQKELVLNLRRMDLPVLMLYPHSVTGVLGNITALGRALGREAEAAELVSRLRARISRIAAPPGGRRPKVYFEMWHDPLMAIGDAGYVGDLIRLAGADNVAKGLAEEYPRVSPELVIGADPDVILLSYCDKPARAAGFVGNRPGWEGIKAVKTGRVYGDLDMDPILRPGPRLADGLEQLVKRIRTE